MYIPGITYEPRKSGELLYHYCSSATMLAILQSRTIRLTDISSMNDSMEMEWGLSLFRRLLVGADLSDPSFPGRVEYTIEAFKARSLQLATCFSTEKDRLSQWRAYSGDGTGFCIGFDSLGVLAMPGIPIRVCYDELEQLEHLSSAIHHHLAEISEVSSEEEQQQAATGIAGVLVELAGMKNPAFEEEKEIRLVHPINVSHVDGAYVAEHDAEFRSMLPEIQFQMRGSVPSPYIDLPFPSGSNPVREIWMGPRANCSERQIQVLLGTLGYRDVAVFKSQASYRAF